MRGYLAFTKKELLESLRTYKLFLMLMIFVFFGILAPLTAKFTPQLLESLMTEGMQITVADPTALDSWVQFFKNSSQLGFVVLTILFSSMMSNEFEKGTLVNMLTKGLPRSTVILSKFTVSSLIWTLSYVVSFVITYMYTAYFWSGDEVTHLFFSVACLWVFGLLLLAVSLLGGVLFRSSYGCLMFVAGFVAVLFLLNIIPSFQNYNPVELMSRNLELLSGAAAPRDLTASIGVTITLLILSILTTIKVFNKKQL